MPKEKERLVSARREEIMNACLELYQTGSFKDITIKDIAKYTSFSRPSIYNYFETKEEIFLGLFQREYEEWTKDLENAAKSCEGAGAQAFAEAIGRSLEKRSIMLKLLAMNLYDMEGNSRTERLIDFKCAYRKALEALEKAYMAALPERGAADAEGFLRGLMPFMCGIYPYTFITEKQRAAMAQAGVHFRQESVYELACHVILQLLK